MVSTPLNSPRRGASSSSGSAADDLSVDVRRRSSAVRPARAGLRTATVLAIGFGALTMNAGSARAQTPAPAAPQNPAPQPQPQPPLGKEPAPPAPGVKPPTAPPNAPGAVAPGQATPEQPADTRPLTLNGAIELALRAQPSLYQSGAQREAALQRLRQQQSDYFPTITPTFTYVASGTRSPVSVSYFDPTTGTVVQRNSGDTLRTTKNGDISLSYRVFDSGQRELANRQARQSLRSSDYGLEDTRQSVIANVANAYFQALQNDALVRVNQAQVDRAQNTLDVVTAQVAAGAAARKDIYQAQSDLLNAQVTLLQAQNNADLAQAQLRQAIGVIGGGGATPGAIGSTPRKLTLMPVPLPSSDMPLAATIVPPGQTPSTPPVLSEDVPSAIDQLLSVAYRERPDVQQAQENVELNRTSKRIAEIQARPQITGDVAAGYVYIPYGGNNRQASLSATWPIFDGGLRRAEIREAQANIVSSRAQLEILRQNVAVEVEQAYRTLLQSRAALPAAQAAVQAAQINYDAAIESRREGVGSIVDVITAQTTLVQAQSQYVQATYQYYAADAALARAVGQAPRIGGNIPATGAVPGNEAPSGPSTAPPGTTPTTPAPGANPAQPGANPANPAQPANPPAPAQ